MTKTNEHHAEVNDEPRDRFSSDIEALKSNVAQLRDDVTRLLQSTVGTGRSGAGMLKDRASTAVGDVKHRIDDLQQCGAESVHEFEQKLAERPLLSAAIALGIGYFLGRLFTTKR